MKSNPSTLLARFERLAATYGNGAATRKLGLLRDLERGSLSPPRALFRLHELLCFLRAYPDDRAVLTQVERMLEGFAERPDLRRGRSALADSGIAGTRIHYSFYWPTACWLEKNWPDRLSIEWSLLTTHYRKQKDSQQHLIRLPELLKSTVAEYCMSEKISISRPWKAIFKRLSPRRLPPAARSVDPDEPFWLKWT